VTAGRAAVWTCPDCGAPFANRNASHSCVRVDLDEHFHDATPIVRQAFDRLVELASVDHTVIVVAQKSRIALALPMRFGALKVQRNKLTGHVLAEEAFEHPVVTAIVPNAYESGLFLHRLSIRSPDELDDAFAGFIRKAAARVGRRERLAARIDGTGAESPGEAQPRR
jgi:hypothetical protein